MEQLGLLTQETKPVAIYTFVGKIQNIGHFPVFQSNKDFRMASTINGTKERVNFGQKLNCRRTIPTFLRSSSNPFRSFSSWKLP